MRRKQLTAAVLCLMLVFTLCGCGKQEPPLPTGQPQAEQSAQPELSSENLGVVSTIAHEMSATQLQLITGSIEIASFEAQDGDVKVTLVSAMGDGCYNCFNLLVELPEGSKIKDAGYGFQSAEILFNDPEAPFVSEAGDFAITDDDNPKDNKYTLRLTVGANRWDKAEYPLDNGTLRTLSLKNIVSGDGKVLYKGQWSFDFTYTGSGEYRELVTSPIPVQGISPDGRSGKESWAEITSFVLSGFSAECRYELKGGEVTEPFSYGLSYIEMKSGEKSLIGCDASRKDGKYEIRDYYLLIPVSIDEVKSIHLSDHVTINVE